MQNPGGLKSDDTYDLFSIHHKIVYTVGWNLV